MADIMSKAKRSALMSRIRGKNTKPELLLRKMLWNRGFRYRLHDSRVIGKPDMSSRNDKVAIFVDGCFWHGCRYHGIMPSSRRRFWSMKIQGNKARDRKVNHSLKTTGWTVIRIWEHEVEKSPKKAMLKIAHKIDLRK